MEIVARGTAMTASPFATLTRHFIGVILSPPLLTELGADYLRRTLSSLAACCSSSACFSISILQEIRGPHSRDQARLLRARLRADTLLMIAVPMLIAGLIAVVISPMMFPDETDYQVLTPLPVTRGHIFTARLCALAAIVAWESSPSTRSRASGFRSSREVGGHTTRSSLRVPAHGAAATLATVWTVSAVMAVQGLS